MCPNGYLTRPQTSHASPECSARSQWVEIELDSTLTARILKQLHPDTEGQNVVFHDAFENVVRLLENQFDLVISNVPFGNFPIVDRSIKDLKLAEYSRLLLCGSAVTD